MKRIVVGLVVLGVLTILAPGSLEAKSAPTCKIEGTWYGFNTFGETYVITFNRTGGRSYTAIGQAPLNPNPFFTFVTGDFPATQGELVRHGRNRFDASWMAISWVDPSYDFDGDPYFGSAGCGSGWDLMALAIWGPLTMPTCDTWTASFDADFIVYSLGTDPFADGCSMGNPFGPGEGFYQRLPKLQ